MPSNRRRRGNTSGKKKRTVRRSSYTIPVDDSTEKLIISVITERMGPSITLKDPRGHVITSGKIYLSKGAIYEINNPRPGMWRLMVSRAGKHSYQVKGSSKTNVDFEYFFIMIPTRGRSKKPIPISHPLLGKCLTVCTHTDAYVIYLSSHQTDDAQLPLVFAINGLLIEVKKADFKRNATENDSLKSKKQINNKKSHNQKSKDYS